MDLIERLFHVSPDGGNGATEVLCVVAALLVIGSLLLRKREMFGAIRRFHR
jgi:hypothetical protein